MCSRSLGTCLFFSVCTLLTLGVTRSDSPRARAHLRFFFWKVPLWAGLVVLSFLPSNAVMDQYFQACRAGGACFLLLQLVFILDYVVAMNERCLEADDGPARATLIGGALVTNAGTIAGIACLYVYLWEGQRDLAFITVTLLLFVLFTAVSLLPATNGGVFTSGAVSAYCLYLCASAIVSDPHRSSGEPVWLQAVGFAIAMCALVYAIFSNQIAFEAREPGDEGGEDAEPEDVHPLGYSFFHLIFVLGAMYSAMLFTNWSSADTYASLSVDKGVASMWVKISCEWACAVLYLWIMVAPCLFPDREFS